MFAGKRILVVSSVVAMCGFGVAGVAQQGRQYTTADYAQAEKFMNYNVNPLVYHGIDRPTWMADGRMWYRDAGPDGVTFVLVDPAKKTKGPAFDQAKLAAAMTAASTGGVKFAAGSLAITEFTLSDGDKTVTLTTGRTKMKCDLSGAGTCTAVADGRPARGGRGGQAAAGAPPVAGAPPAAAARGGRGATVLSPDKTKEAFLRDYNLWVRDVATGTETQLTTDGVKDYGYATNNAGWAHTDGAVVLWSPDSKKIATFQQDQRKTQEMYLVPVTNSHPKLEAWKYPLVGDKDVTTVERVVIDVPTAKVVRFKMAPDQHRSTTCDDLACRGGWDDVQFSDDDSHIGFISSSRDHKQVWLREADTTTGDVREVMTEVTKTFYEGGAGRSNWKYLPKTNEFLWFSERDGWGQMYLYDLTTGKLKNQITKGEGNVSAVLRVDEAARTIYFTGGGKEKGRDPYFSHLYKVNFDGGGFKLLTPENADHAVTFSQDGQYFVDVYSTPVQPQTAVVRDSSGALVVEVGKQDISKLVAAGWVPPTPITVKARDGKTDIYGLMFKPTKMEPGKKYPIVNNVYPGPQTGSCGSRAFAASHKDDQALAELGFVVVCIDGMGTPGRSKAFHEAYYGDMGDATIPDQVAGMKELAAKYNYIDISKAGMYGHSGGGNATASAMFHFPDFFKVGIAESGNHDQRDYEDDWAEKWSGLEVKNADGTSNYDSQANQNFAKNLKGHLLLAHGTMDDNVPMNNTLLVVDALIKANKDFDLLLIPNVPHGYGPATNYMTRRRWDYFVRYLAGNTPPKEYEMKPAETTPAGGGPDDEDGDDSE